jgi:hypothetical protein
MDCLVACDVNHSTRNEMTADRMLEVLDSAMLSVKIAGRIWRIGRASKKIKLTR